MAESMASRCASRRTIWTQAAMLSYGLVVAEQAQDA